jgi:hypothetical protein
MIEVLAAISMSTSPQAGSYISQWRRDRVEFCRDMQTGLFILGGKLGRPDTDREASAIEARSIHDDCNGAAIDMLGDPWTAPCGQLMLRIAAHAGGLGEAHLGRRSADEIPSFIYPQAISHSQRCHQIIEGEQP